MAQPIRTCVLCRQSDVQQHLIRLVCSPDQVIIVDLKRRLPGAGAWVHPNRTCVLGVEEKPSVLNRAFGRKVVVNGLLEQIKEAIFRGINHGLSQASAGSALVGGADLLRAAIQRSEIDTVVLASDASDRVTRKLSVVASDAISFITLPIDKDTLGARVGKGSLAAVGVGSTTSSVYLIRLLQVWGALG